MNAIINGVNPVVLCDVLKKKLQGDGKCFASKLLKTPQGMKVKHGMGITLLLELTKYTCINIEI